MSQGSAISFRSRSSGSWAMAASSGACGIETLGPAAHHRGEVEAEAGHPAQPAPGAQGVHGQAQARPAVQRQRIAGAGVVDVERRIVRAQPVIAGVVQSAQRQGRAQGVAFAGVVEAPHPATHSMPASARASVAARTSAQPPGASRGSGASKRDRIVAPVVAQAERRQVALVDPGGGGHATRRVVTPSRRRWSMAAGMGEAGEGPAHRLGDVRMGPGEAAHVQLVDHRLAPGDGGRARRGGGRGAVTMALGMTARAVGLVEAVGALRIARRVAEHRRIAGRTAGRAPGRRDRPAACSG